MVQFVVGGLITGSILAVCALAIVITYNTSKIFNFALPGVAYFLAYVYYEFSVKLGLPVALSVLITVVGAAGLGLLFYWVAFRHLERAPQFVKLTVMVGLQVAFISAGRVAFGNAAINDAIGFFRGHVPVVHIGGVAINGNQLVALSMGIVVAVATPLIMSTTTAGLVLRAVVDDAGASRRAGVRVHFVGACSWMLAFILTAFVGIAVTPIVNLDASAITALIVASFAGAVIGRLTNMALAFIGALLLGVAQGVILPYLPTTGLIGTGLRPSLPFIFIILAIVGYRILGLTDVLEEQGRSRAQQIFAGPLVRPPKGGILGGPVLIVVAIVVPLLFGGFWVSEFAASLALGIVFLSWKLVAGEGGMVSLVQATLAAAGAVAAAQFSTVEGWPIVVSMVLGAIVAALIGLAVGVLILRLSAVYAALGTYAVALFFDNFLFSQSRYNPFQAGVPFGPLAVGSFTFDESGISYYILIVAVFFVIAALLRNLRRSDTGLVLATVRSSQDRSRTFGLNRPITQTVLFGIGAFIAGIGGSLYSISQLSAEPLAFSAEIGLLWFALFMLWGSGSTFGCIATGLSVVALPRFLTQHLSATASQSLPILFGLAAIGLARHPEGVAEQMKSDFKRISDRVRLRLERRLTASVDDAAPDFLNDTHLVPSVQMSVVGDAEAGE